MKIFVAFPHDRGCPFKLVVEDDSAVISEETAVRLMQLGVPGEDDSLIRYGRGPGRDFDLATIYPGALETLKLSRKARRLLGVNTLSLFP